jgi:DNA repair ATPase RecN
MSASVSTSSSSSGVHGQYPFDEKMYAQYLVKESYSAEAEAPQQQQQQQDLCPHLRNAKNRSRGSAVIPGSLVMVSSLSHCDKCVQVRHGQGEYVHLARVHLDLSERIPLLCYFCNKEENQWDDVKEAFKVGYTSIEKCLDRKCKNETFLISALLHCPPLGSQAQEPDDPGLVLRSLLAPEQTISQV